MLAVLLAGCPPPATPPADGGSESEDGGAESSELPPPPGAPQDVQATAEDGRIVVSWSPVEGATSYHLYFGPSAGLSTASAAVVRDVASPFAHPGCGAGATCFYVMTAGNRGGESPASAEMSATLSAALVPPAPSGLDAQPGDGEVLLDWAATAGAVGYHLYWSTAPGVSPSAGTRVSVAAPPYRHLGRANGTAYYYVVTALSAAGESAPSAEVSATPRPAPPGAPASVYAVSGADRISLWWSPLAGATGYRIYWSQTSGVTPATGTRIDAAQSPYVHVPLSDGTTLFYVVTAVTDSGEGPASNEASATVANLPPVNVTARPTVGAIDLSWSPSGRAGTTGNNIYWSTTPGITPATGTKLANRTSPFRHTGLTNGVRYYYVVTSTSATGEGAPSPEVSASPVRSAPAAPTLTRGNAQITLTWSPATGAASYNLYWSTTAGVTPATGNKLATVTSPYVHTGLTNGTRYYYVLTTVSAFGDESLPSAERSAIPILGTPVVTAVPGDRQVTLSWDPVPGATSYDLYWDVDDVWNGSNLIADVTSPFVHTGLTNETTYDYAVIAHDSSSSSPWPPEVSATPPGPPTGPAQNLAATAGPAQVTLTWDPAPIATGYNVYYSTSPGVTPLTGTLLAGRSSPYVHRGLTAGTTYHYVVTPTAVGIEGPASAEVSATPPAMALSAPTGLLTLQRHRAIVLRWSPVTGASGYNVYWAATPGVTPGSGTQVSGLASTLFIHAPLPVGATYHYVVTAVNGPTESAASAEVSATAQAAPRVVAAGYASSLAVKADGTAWGFGENGVGELGDGTTTDRPAPVRVGTLSSVVQVASGEEHGLAILGNGELRAWGSNASGALGDGTLNPSTSPVAVMLDSTTAFTGAEWVSGGDGFSLAVKSDGTVWSWGYGAYGRLGNDGSSRSYPGPVLGPGATPLTGVWKVAAGDAHGLALKTDGTVWAWGSNSSGEVGDGSYLQRGTAVQVRYLDGTYVSDVVDIAAGEDHSLALRRDGRVLAWGDNWDGRLGDGTKTRRLAAVLSVQASGDPIEQAVAVAAGGHSLVALADGTVWSFGYNWYGGLGDGTSLPATRAVQVVTSGGAPLTGITAVEAGSYHSLVFGSGPGFFAFGLNGNGQLGGASPAGGCGTIPCALSAQQVDPF